MTCPECLFNYCMNGVENHESTKPSKSYDNDSRQISFLNDTGYPHDGRADNTAYRHDRRADKRRYPHDREIDIQMLKNV